MMPQSLQGSGPTPPQRVPPPATPIRVASFAGAAAAATTDMHQTPARPYMPSSSHPGTPQQPTAMNNPSSAHRLHTSGSIPFLQPLNTGDSHGRLGNGMGMAGMTGMAGMAPSPGGVGSLGMGMGMELGAGLLCHPPTDGGPAGHFLSLDSDDGDIFGQAHELGKSFLSQPQPLGSTSMQKATSLPPEPVPLSTGGSQPNFGGSTSVPPSPAKVCTPSYPTHIRLLGHQRQHARIKGEKTCLSTCAHSTHFHSSTSRTHTRTCAHSTHFHSPTSRTHTHMHNHTHTHRFHYPARMRVRVRVWEPCTTAAPEEQQRAQPLPCARTCLRHTRLRSSSSGRLWA